MFYASVIPFYISYRTSAIDKKYLVISITFGLGLFIHGFYHLFRYFNYTLLEKSFEFLSAFLILLMLVYYIYTRMVIS